MAKVKLQQVAQKAGVSVATVDRVLNHRAGVRAVTAERVNAAIRDLDYQPDRLAARLARAREYRFRFVLPIGHNVFMRAIEDQLGLARQHFQQDRIDVSIQHTDVFDGHGLADCLENTPDNFDGVAVVALDHPAVREAIDGLLSRGIPVVTLVSDLPGSRRCHYVGVDNYAAGRTAGSLLGRFGAGRVGQVGLIAGSLALRDHAERKYGFEQVLAQEFPTLQVLAAREGHDDDKQAQQATAGLIREHPDLVGLYSIGAGNRGVINALEAANANPILIAHELTPETRKALLRGTVDAVINQDAGHEVRSALRVLQALNDHQAILPSQERIRIDILLRDNIPPQR